MRLLSLLFIVVAVEAKLRSSEGDEDDLHPGVITDVPPHVIARRMKKVAASRSSRKREEAPPMEKANCPPNCNCSTSTVACVQTDYSDPNIFLMVNPLAFPHLDTLILSGNRLGDLSSNSLFGTHQRHESLTLVNLTDNRISGLSTDTFLGMPNLEYLYLSKNLLRSLSRNTFGALQKLRYLHLREAIAHGGKAAEPGVLASAFDAIHGLAQLKELDLSGNALGELRKNTFCKLPELERLLLAKNALSSFEVEGGCLQGLHHLDLSGNSFRKLSPSLWEAFPQMAALDVSQNPLECDCDLKEFVELAKREKTRFLNQGKTLCASPPALAGKSIFDLKAEQVCVPASSNLLSNLFLLLLLVGVVFVVYRFYRHRIPVPPAFQFGYSSLSERESASREPEPAFL